MKLNVSLQDLGLFGLVNDIMREMFDEPFPARAALQVAKLPLDSSIEVSHLNQKLIISMTEESQDLQSIQSLRSWS